MRYEVLEHKADLKIRAFGKTKKELFKNMLLGMNESQRPETKGKKKIKREIKIRSFGYLSLLIDFLSKVLYYNQTGREIYNDARFTKFTETELKVKLSGCKVERFGEDIKAVTYHGLEVKQNEEGSWQATVLFDI